MKSIKTIADVLMEHDFFEGLSQEEIQFIAGCGKNVMFHEGEVIAEPGDPADLFYLIRDGRVALSIAEPPRRPFLFQTLGPKDLVGLSWLIPPYHWTVKAQALVSTRTIAFDGACIRKKCESDANLGYKLLQHIIGIMVRREEAARLHLLDVYGEQE